MRARLQRAMTLVELVCVMLILGVLASAAVVRFGDVSVAAHRASVAGTADAFTTALRLAYIYCQLRHGENKDNLPGYGDGKVDFNAQCYPVDINGQNTIGNNAQRCVRVWESILKSAPSISGGNAQADYRARASNNVCTYQYTKDTSVAREFTYDSITGLVVMSNP